MAEFITSRVVLYKNGIGSFERNGIVEKETTIELFFPADAMNDILKSINVSSNANHKHSITYEVPSSTSSGTHTPISNHRELYTRLVRETVLLRTADKDVEGMVLAVDYPHDIKDASSGKITVFTKDNNVVTLPLSAVVSMQVPNNLVSQSKSLKININPEQKQDIKITYIRSCPVWKPTYRAILGASPTEYKLYGWATIHNPGPDDWQGTLVSLVAGQPVSFINEVYKPKYRSRPKMRATNTPLGISGLLVSSLLNENSDSDSDSDSDRTPKRVTDRRSDRRGHRRRVASDSDEASRSRSRSPRNGTTPAPPASTSESEAVDLFRYDLVTPVNLKHGHSALVPIFDATVRGRKVALYNPTLHKEHPFSTLVLSNTTGLSLEVGSMTVFDGDMYIGEAHLIATKPNERRFLPFALEQGVVIQSLPVTSSLQPVHHLLLNHCTLTLSRKNINKYHYVINNKSEKTIELLLEHPKEFSKPVDSVSLIVEECYYGTDKIANRIEVKTEYVTGTGSSGNYGLNFVVPPRAVTHLVLHSQFVDTVNDSLRSSEYLKRNLGEGLLSRISAVLTPYWNLEKSISDIERMIKSEKDRIAELDHNQARTRSNLSAVSQSDKHRSRYTDQIDKLETEIAQGNTKIKELQAQLQATKDKLKITAAALSFDSNNK